MAQSCSAARDQNCSHGAVFQGAESIRHFPAGALLEIQGLAYEDVLLSGWVGLKGPNASSNELIGVLLPGDRMAAVLDGRLCSAVALTSVSLAADETHTNESHEFRHLIRQCIRTCHLSASDRIEDFFVESYERLAAVELASDWSFDFPLSQAMLGNILGLCAEHVNRVLKQLQAKDHIQIVGRTVTLLRPEALRSLKAMAAAHMTGSGPEHWFTPAGLKDNVSIGTNVLL